MDFSNAICKVWAAIWKQSQDIHANISDKSEITKKEYNRLYSLFKKRKIVLEEKILHVEESRIRKKEKT